MTRKPIAPKRGPLDNGGAIRFKEAPAEEIYVPLARLDSSHQAIASGDCARCDQRYRTGDWVFRDAEGRLVGVNCCAGTGDLREPTNDPLPLGTSYADFGEVDLAEEIEGRDFVPMSQVMPAGRSKADMCMKCFQIPASNGVCGC